MTGIENAMSRIGIGETTDEDLMLPTGTGVNVGRAMHRRETGEKDARGARVMRQIRREGATATGIEKRTEIASDTIRCLHVDTQQYPTAATPASAAPGITPPGGPTHPAPGQTAGTRRIHSVADLMHQQRLIPAMTPTTAPYLPSLPTHGRNRMSPWKGHPGGEEPVGRAPAPKEAQK